MSLREPSPAAGAPEIILILPDDHRLVSGGNHFNAGLLEGLAAIGHPHRGVLFDEALDLAAAGTSATFVLDSVLLPRAAELRARLLPAGQSLLLFVHHLAVFEPWNRAPAMEEETRRLLAVFDGFIAGSLHATDLLQSYQVGRPVIVIPPALAIRPRGIQPGAGEFRGLVVASIIRCKGVRPLIESLGSRLVDGDFLHLDVVGRDDFEPDETRACGRLLASDTRLARAVTLHGPVPAASMPGWYERSTVFVSASEHETFGMAFHEARAFGLPILALDRPHSRLHITAPKHGRLHHTIDDLAASCVALDHDRSALEALRRSAFAHRLRDARTWSDAARELVSIVSAE